MLTIQTIDGRPRALLLCERCGEQIPTHEDGVALYEVPGAPLLFFHHDCENEDTHQHHFSISLAEVFTTAVELPAD